MRCRALAVQCCAYHKQQALAVERLARCNNDVGATCILQGTIIVFTRREATRCCAACSAVRALTCLSNPAVGCRAPTSAATTSAGACKMRVSLFNKKGGRGHACT